MEVRVYLNFESYAGNKVLYSAKVNVPSAFEFHKTLDVMRSIYGPSIIVVFICPN